MSSAPTPIDAQTAFTGTVAPTGADILDADKLANWMASNVEGFEGPVEVLKFAGGQSNPTYRLNAKWFRRPRRNLWRAAPTRMRLTASIRLSRVFIRTGFRRKPFGLCTDDSVADRFIHNDW